MKPWRVRIGWVNSPVLRAKDLVFQFLGEIVALEVAEVATLLGGGAVGLLAGEFVELGAALELLINVVGLGFGGGHLLGSRLLQVARLAGLRLGSAGIVGNQNFAEADALGLGNLGLVLLIKLLNFVARDLDVAADFRADHLLGENAVLGVLLELLPADALRFGELLQLFHRAGLHLLAQVIQALDQIGVGGNPQVGCLLDEQLLVDEIAQGVCLAILDLLLRQVLLLGILGGLLVVPAQIGTGDDRVIDPRDDLLNDACPAARGRGRRRNR